MLMCNFYILIFFLFYYFLFKIFPDNLYGLLLYDLDYFRNLGLFCKKCVGCLFYSDFILFKNILYFKSLNNYGSAPIIIYINMDVGSYNCFFYYFYFFLC